MNEDDKISDEAVLGYLSNPELLRAYGYQLTPKGAMVLVLMARLGLSSEEAEEIAIAMDNTIFLSGYVYLHETQIDLKDPKSD